MSVCTVIPLTMTMGTVQQHGALACVANMGLHPIQTVTQYRCESKSPLWRKKKRRFQLSERIGYI